MNPANLRATILASLVLLVSACVSHPAGSPAPTRSADSAEAEFEPLHPAAPTFDFSTVVDPNHQAHSVADLHHGGYGLKRVGQTGVQGILAQGMTGSITAIDVWNGYALVAGDDENGPAFVIVDIHDAAHPKPVGYAATNAPGFTARFSKDGNFVFYGCQVLVPAGAHSDCKDPTAVKPGQTPGGVVAFNVSDKTHPRAVAFVGTQGTHNLETQSINGTDYVFTDATDIVKFDRATNTLTKIGSLPGRHDVTVVRHPVTHDWLLYTGTNQLAIYNVNDPAHPDPVYAETWTGGEGWHDQVPFPRLVDGRALLALGGEALDGDGVRGLRTVTLVDITDPSQPKELSRWTPPFKPIAPWAEYMFSVHEMAATPQGQLAVAWYHGGVWVLDVSTQERQAKPVILAAYQPDLAINDVPSAQPDTPMPIVPNVWGAGWDHRGYLVIPDKDTGVYVLEPSWGLHPTLDGGQ